MAYSHTQNGIIRSPQIQVQPRAPFVRETNGSSGRRTVAVLVWYCNHTNFLHRNDGASSLRQCGRLESYLQCILYSVSYFSTHTGQVSSFGGCMAQASYFDTARRLASFLAKKPRFVTTSKLRSCHKAPCLLFQNATHCSYGSQFISCMS